MFNIIIITALVTCTSGSSYTHKNIASSEATFQQDIALLRKGWYAEENGRCKAVKITYRTGSVYE